MNTENIKIDGYLKTKFSHIPNLMDTCTNLSKSNDGIPLVSDITETYNFDSISNDIYKPKCHKSSDALYLKEELYLIEFKNGFPGNNRTYKEIKNSIIAKISTSLHTLEKVIFAGANVDTNNLKRNYILVLNSTSLGVPITAVAIAMAKLSGELPSEKGIYSALCNYELPFYESNRLFYDKIIILNDINFSKNLFAFK